MADPMDLVSPMTDEEIELLKSASLSSLGRYGDHASDPPMRYLRLIKRIERDAARDRDKAGYGGVGDG